MAPLLAAVHGPRRQGGLPKSIGNGGAVHSGDGGGRRLGRVELGGLELAEEEAADERPVVRDDSSNVRMNIYIRFNRLV